MKINLLTGFAAGVLAATAISGAVYFTGDQSDAKAALKSSASHSSAKVQGLSEKEMKKALETKGYVVQTKAEYDKSTKDAKASADQKQPAPEENQSKTVTKVVVNVAQGMTSIDVGKTLVNAGLIQDAYQFTIDIEQRGLQNKLRPGTYNVDSGMTYDQMIAAIFQN